MDSPNKRTRRYLTAGASLLLCLALVSLCIGRYPLSLKALLSGDEYQLRIFFGLRLSRVILGVCGGFVLAIAGYSFQIIFHNPLASPDIIGISSGASAGAAFGILFFGAAWSITLCSFGGALLAVILALLLARLDSSGSKSTIVLSGVAIHSLAQTLLMYLKISADPERQLASIEYWIMGSLNAANAGSLRLNLLLASLCVLLSVLLHRQLLLLSAEEDEAGFLGVRVHRLRFLMLVLATLMVSAVISLTGLISFIGLIAPHCGRLLTGKSSTGTMLLSGLIGGLILCLADILARSLTAAELPVSIFTSLIGAPFLVALVLRG